MVITCPLRPPSHSPGSAPPLGWSGTSSSCWRRSWSWGWAVALYGTLRDLLDAVYPYPGGWLADRLGRRASLILFAGLAIGGYAVYMVAPTWPWILAGTVLVMAWSSLTLPAIFGVLGDHLPAGRRATGFGVQAILKRVPIILAPPLGGWLIARLGFQGGMRAGLAVT